jgi:hypothetical protein
MIAFDADGLGTGYQGCQLSYKVYPFFISSDENNASGIAPDLCPFGKYGYDPRCRRWYTKNRNSLAKQNPILVTAPYVFASDIVGIPITSPLVNQNSNEHVGQILLDIKPIPTEYLSEVDGAISFLISMDSDIEHDTVIGPNKSTLELPSSIAKTLFPGNDVNTKRFQTDVLPRIKLNTPNSENASIVYDDISKQIFICDAVKVRGLHPEQVNDFTLFV